MYDNICSPESQYLSDGEEKINAEILERDYTTKVGGAIEHKQSATTIRNLAKKLDDAIEI